MKKIVAAALMATGLAGCMSNAPATREDMPQQPSSAEITRVAVEAYSFSRGRDPRNLRITKVGSDNYIGPNQWDYFACLKITERQETTSYYSDGRVARAAGTDHDQPYILHLRQYDYGWGSGILRRVDAASDIGRRATLELCPAG
ncbi:hypothetical protein [Loktanella sp. IMCC34160]|uniref:hypothetical protein n=1 Tax=Loktanella sp. IMCC34160 TaxID=2510646 RepID=UPI0013EBF0F1|nr:hypothetical protein [Loktanella sp. IMCC34160]